MSANNDEPKVAVPETVVLHCQSEVYKWIDSLAVSKEKLKDAERELEEKRKDFAYQQKKVEDLIEFTSNCVSDPVETRSSYYAAAQRKGLFPPPRPPMPADPWHLNKEAIITLIGEIERDAASGDKSRAGIIAVAAEKALKLAGRIPS
jgi:hypothetical protein